MREFVHFISTWLPDESAELHITSTILRTNLLTVATESYFFVSCTNEWTLAAIWPIEVVSPEPNDGAVRSSSHKVFTTSLLDLSVRKAYIAVSDHQTSCSRSWHGPANSM